MDATGGGPVLPVLGGRRLGPLNALSRSPRPDRADWNATQQQEFAPWAQRAPRSRTLGLPDSLRGLTADQVREALPPEVREPLRPVPPSAPAQERTLLSPRRGRQLQDVGGSAGASGRPPRVLTYPRPPAVPPLELGSVIGQPPPVEWYGRPESDVPLSVLPEHINASARRSGEEGTPSPLVGQSPSPHPSGRILAPRSRRRRGDELPVVSGRHMGPGTSRASTGEPLSRWPTYHDPPSSARDRRPPSPREVAFVAGRVVPKTARALRFLEGLRQALPRCRAGGGAEVIDGRLRRRHVPTASQYSRFRLPSHPQFVDCLGRE